MPKEVPPANFLKYKAFIEDRFKIVDKNQRTVDFKLNQPQRRFINEATGRDVILKARQFGFSSLILAVFASDFLLKENTLSVVVADIVNNAQDLLERVKGYIKSYEAATKTIVPLRYNSKYELYNSANNSRYIIGTAENHNFGRSKTITNLHLSEAAYYPNFLQILAGAGTALVPNGKFIIETTANGFNDFKSFWDATELSQNDFTPHFYPAQEFYSKDFLESEKKRLGRIFAQEYPSSPAEAFLTSGDPYFDPLALQWHMENAQDPIPEPLLYKEAMQDV